MIIINQDKDEIFNFDKISNIWINNPLDNDEGEFTIYADDDLLGTYDTEERAKEVLNELAGRIVLTNRFKALNSAEGQEQMIVHMYDASEPLFEYIMPEK